MLPFSSTLSSQIGFLLQTLNDSNYESVLHELCQLADYGVECSILLLQTCFDQVNIHEGDMQNMQLKSNLLTAIFRYLLDKPNISTVFCGSLRSTMMNEGFLGDLSMAFHFSTSEKIGLGLALSDSEDLDLRTKGQNFCMAQIEELLANPSVVSHDQIQNILVFLYRSDGLSQHVDAFVRMLSLLQEKEKTPLVLAPMLMNDLCEVNPLRNLDSYADCDEHDFDSMVAEIEKEMSMVDIMKELGYGCTVNGSSCKELLSLFSPLDEVTISRIISTIVRTRTGLDDTQSTYATFCSALGSSSLSDSSSPSSWNIDVLLDSIKQLAPETNWKTVMENLDHEGFYVPDEESFSLFMTIYADACPGQFPLHAVCGSVWNNTEGQLSFLKYAVSAPPEKFTFSHSPRQLSFIEPVQGNKLPYGGGNQAWTCLDLLEVLCNLAEKGHVSTVQTLLEYPLKHCPEVLLIGIAHINTAFDFLQYEVLSIVFPLIVGNAMKSDGIHQLWRVNPNLVLRGFVDVSNADPENISRILNICTELKIFSTVLDMAPFSFGIKLAAFASRKEHLNLEKWLSENLSMYKDAFFEECLKFLKEVSIDLASDGPTNPFQNSGAFGNVISETSSTFFKVLQAHSGQLLSHQLADDLKRLHATTIHVNPRLQSAGAVDLSASDGFPDDIEATANSFFDQIFSGELTMEAAIKMLAHFKGSSDKREQGIFECVIRNLFDEYKFLHRYPERQLKITAVLFGSLIKHQLVYHLALGCALRCVLDALRKSVDSKMFMFGSKALEQFTERLVEWPQYCNHILQISHLRGTHAELMAFIERSLARISSSQSEPNGGRGTPTDQSQSSTAQATVENTEVSEASWQLMGSTSTTSGQQLSSPVQIQQRHQGLLEDRQKTSATSVSYIKPLLNPSGQSSASTQFDLVTNQKSSGALSLQNVSSQQAVSGSGPVPNPGFLRPTRALTPAGMPRQQAYNTGFGAALNIETLVAAAERRDTAIEAPASEIQDRILFMINNISAANMEAKAKEFTEILKEHYYPWFAQYMVMKRASIEPNFHDLYLKFLDKVNSKALNKEIVKATYENCKVLLRSELIKSSSEERSLLKNLGSWLGKFTIGRNQALRAREIDPKVLIMEAYEKGLMIAVIPFTSKILEPCQCSMAYQPPNPWTMGILGLLSEIYNLPNLKMNLKFDIEVLYKNLGVDMKDVKPTSLLKDRVREIEGNPDFSNKDLGLSHQQMVTDINTGLVSSLSQAELQPEGANHALSGGHANILNQYTAPIHLVSSTLSEDEKLGPLSLSERLSSGQGLPQVAPSQSPFSISQLPTPLPNIGTHVVVNQKLNALGLNLQFQRILTMAMERAIREVITPVIERSITIACMTTKELVLKDYAMESDESRIHHSANLMVASLAGSLAHVTCKEPLRHSMSNHLRSSLQALNVTSEFLEQAIQLVTNDNLDLGCAVVEQAATEKALQNIDEVIAHMLSIRRKQRDGLNSTFFDASTYAQGTLARLPEALRPKPGRLSIAQQRVYEDFVRFPWQNQTSQSSNTVPGGPSGGSGLSRVYNSSLGQLNPNIYSAAQLAAGFSNAAQPLDQISGEIDAGSIPLSVSSSHVGATDDGVLQHGVENVIPSLTQTFTGTEVHTEESPSIKDSGASVVQPSISASVTEREPLLTTGDALDMYETVAQKLENLISKDARDSEIQGVIAEVPEIVLRCVSRDEAALAIAQKVFKSLYENTSNSTHVGSHLAILVAIRDVCKLVVKELTSWVVYSDEERKFNKDITVGLIRSELLNLAEYNVHIAKLIDAGRNKAATEFAISLVKTSVDQESGVSVSEVYNLFDALAKLAMRPGSPESLQQLVETARNLSSGAVAQSGFATGKDDKARQFRDKKVTPGRMVTGRDDSNLTGADSGASDARDQASLLLAEWLRICEYNGTSDTVLAPYIAHLQQSGMLKGDDHMDRLFRLLTEFSVSHCLPSSEANTLVPMSLQAPQQLQNLSFNAIDMYAKLVVLVVKYCAVDQGSNKISLLPKILSVTVRVIQKDAEEKKFAFNSRPYFRLFINWLLDICSPDPTLDATNFQVLTAFANAFHALQPLKVPAFSFSWLELVSHRSFMPKLLVINSQKGWPFVQRLLVDLFKFMEPYLRNAELGEPVHFLYKGTLRVLLVLLHDFPEFLCDYHFSFCDVIPPSCIQMRNVILSAFPRNMRLPDPFTPNLKVDLLPEITQSPRILSEVDGALKVKQMKADIDEYLKTRQPGSTFLAELKQRLMLPQAEATLTGTKYNVPLINSLVLYVGMQAIQQLQSKSTPQQLAVPTPPMTHSAPMDIFQKLIIDLDTEGRYLFLNAVANQLRYPNNHTHYFSCVLLFLFAEANQDIIQEQITRVLLERLIVNRPHPWGLLITFIELIKNPRYSFWSRSFTHCAPEIEKLFESVARSCGGPGMKATEDGDGAH